MFAWAIFAIGAWAEGAGKGWAARSSKWPRRRAGVRVETYAHRHLRRRGYVLVARNLTFFGPDTR
jgi:hypothetical protein